MLVCVCLLGELGQMGKTKTYKYFSNMNFIYENRSRFGYTNKHLD